LPQRRRPVAFCCQRQRFRNRERQNRQALPRNAIAHSAGRSARDQEYRFPTTQDAEHLCSTGVRRRRRSAPGRKRINRQPRSRPVLHVFAWLRITTRGRFGNTSRLTTSAYLVNLQTSWHRTVACRAGEASSISAAIVRYFHNSRRHRIASPVLASIHCVCIQQVHCFLWLFCREYSKAPTDARRFDSSRSLGAQVDYDASATDSVLGPYQEIRWEMSERNADACECMLLINGEYV